MKISKTISTLLMLFSITVHAQVFYFEVRFTDKANSLYSTDAPLNYLSEKSVQRRINQRISVQEEDMPINQNYLDSVAKWLSIKSTSKWFNLVSVATKDSAKIDSLKKYAFVKSLKYIGKKHSGNLKTTIRAKNMSDTIDYGQSAAGIKQLHGDFLHQLGFLGQNKTIAILDGGFTNADKMVAFEHLFKQQKIIACRNFVNPGSHVFTANEHGTMVLSILAGKKTKDLFGSATDANYILLVSEDVDQENLIEEYYWLHAAEYADSAGADVINSSLGYFDFDSPQFNHKYSDLYQNTTIISQAANKVFEKGILVFNSAGNEGSHPWKYIIFPADAQNVISVGAVDLNAKHAYFSSYAYDFPLHVKPNMAALGSGIYVQSAENSYSYANGTSFSSPLLCGIATCLWQAFPEKSNIEMKDIIQQCAHQYLNPDASLGYGIPNFKKAYLLLQEQHLDKSTEDIYIYPNPITSGTFNIQFKSASTTPQQYSLYASTGKLVHQQFINIEQKISNLTYEFYVPEISKGIYFLEILSNQGSMYSKVIF